MGSKFARLQDRAYQELGFALHAAMDSTSPSLEGFQVFDSLDLESWRRHGNLPNSCETLIHAQTPKNTRSTLDVMERVIKGDKL